MCRGTARSGGWCVDAASSATCEASGETSPPESILGCTCCWNPLPSAARSPQSRRAFAYRERRRAQLASAIATKAESVAGLGTTDIEKLPVSLNGPMASVTKTSVLNVPLMRTEP